MPVNCQLQGWYLIKSKIGGRYYRKTCNFLIIGSDNPLHKVMHGKPFKSGCGMTILLHKPDFDKFSFVVNPIDHIMGKNIITCLETGYGYNFYIVLVEEPD